MSKFIPILHRLEIECWILDVQFILATWNIQYPVPQGGIPRSGKYPTDERKAEYKQKQAGVIAVFVTRTKQT